jgi:hypothetical protein
VRWLKNVRTILFFAALGNPFSFVLLMLLLVTAFGTTPLNPCSTRSTVAAFLSWMGLAGVGLVVAPLLSLPRALLARYELRKVRLATHRIDAGLRERARGNLSVPEGDEEGRVSLSVSRSRPASPPPAG